MDLEGELALEPKLDVALELDLEVDLELELAIELELELELIEALMVVGDAVMAFTVCRCSTSTGPKASTESSV